MRALQVEGKVKQIFLFKPALECSLMLFFLFFMIFSLSCVMKEKSYMPKEKTLSGRDYKKQKKYAAETEKPSVLYLNFQVPGPTLPYGI